MKSNPAGLPAVKGFSLNHPFQVTWGEIPNTEYITTVIIPPDGKRMKGTKTKNNGLDIRVLKNIPGEHILEVLATTPDGSSKGPAGRVSFKIVNEKVEEFKELPPEEEDEDEDPNQIPNLSGGTGSTAGTGTGTSPAPNPTPGSGAGPVNRPAGPVSQPTSGTASHDLSLALNHLGEGIKTLVSQGVANTNSLRTLAESNKGFAEGFSSLSSENGPLAQMTQLHGKTALALDGILIKLNQLPPAAITTPTGTVATTGVQQKPQKTKKSGNGKWWLPAVAIVAMVALVAFVAMKSMNNLTQTPPPAQSIETDKAVMDARRMAVEANSKANEMQQQVEAIHRELNKPAPAPIAQPITVNVVVTNNNINNNCCGERQKAETPAVQPPPVPAPTAPPQPVAQVPQQKGYWYQEVVPVAQTVQTYVEPQQVVIQQPGFNGYYYQPYGPSCGTSVGFRVGIGGGYGGGGGGYCPPPARGGFYSPTQLSQPCPPQGGGGRGGHGGRR